jgi:hypothetical protein
MKRPWVHPIHQLGRPDDGGEAEDAWAVPGVHPPNGLELSGAAKLHRTCYRAEAASAPASC